VIERPKRAVTRFFIPLIDVLILLFCIFLFMPFMSQPGAAGTEDVEKTAPDPKELTPEEMKRDIAGLRADLDRARKDVRRLKDERADPTAKLSVSVLEIDPKSGALYYFRDGDRLPVKDARAALDVIDDHKRRSGVGKEPFFIILMPRELSGYPSGRQIAEYENWFKGVPHRFDNPLGPVLP
jgi:hypothetical protein